MNFQVYHHKALVSTNETLAGMLSEGDPAEGTVVLADYQSGGKGHSGNIWQSEKGKNLLFSLLLKPEFLPPQRQFDLSRILCLALHDVLGGYCPDSRIKWPNDMMIGDKKVAGILIENALQGKRILHSIAGVGLNVNQAGFDPGIPSPTSLCLEKGCHFGIPALLEDLLGHFSRWYWALHSGNQSAIYRSYMKNLYRRGIWSEFRSGGAVFAGKILKVLPGGELMVLRQNGEKEKFGFKEIEYVS